MKEVNKNLILNSWIRKLIDIIEKNKGNIIIKKIETSIEKRNSWNIFNRIKFRISIWNLSINLIV